MENKTLIEQLEEFRGKTLYPGEEYEKYISLWKDIKQDLVPYSEDLIVDKYFNIRTKDTILNNSVFSITNQENCIFDIIVSKEIINTFKFIIEIYKLDSKIYEKSILERYKNHYFDKSLSTILYENNKIELLIDSKIATKLIKFLKETKIDYYANSLYSMYVFGFIDKQKLEDLTKPVNY